MAYINYSHIHNCTTPWLAKGLRARVEEQRAERGEDRRVTGSDVHALGRVFVQIEEALDARADARRILILVVVGSAHVCHVRI